MSDVVFDDGEYCIIQEDNGAFSIRKHAGDFYSCEISGFLFNDYNDALVVVKHILKKIEVVIRLEVGAE